MPRDKDLKRLVRARMKKTGEAYTAARTQIITKTRRKTAAQTPSASVAAPPSANYAALAGTKDEVLTAKTGRPWREWVELLDQHGAEKMAHGDVAALVNQKYGVDGWWSQLVTVGYERIKGLRVRGQRRDGSYEASKSRTYNVAVDALFEAWADAGIRRRWLNEPGVKVRTATAPKTMRLGWPDGGIVAVGFMPKGTGKSAVALAHTKLPSREASDRFKKYWSEQLDALALVLVPAKSRSSRTSGSA